MIEFRDMVSSRNKMGFKGVMFIFERSKEIGCPVCWAKRALHSIGVRESMNRDGNPDEFTAGKRAAYGWIIRTHKHTCGGDFENNND